MKDCAPENRGGYKGPPLKRGSVNTNKDNLIFFPLGKGGNVLCYNRQPFSYPLVRYPG